MKRKSELVMEGKLKNHYVLRTWKERKGVQMSPGAQDDSKRAFGVRNPVLNEIRYT
jgi:hypothetical protein